MINRIAEEIRLIRGKSEKLDTSSLEMISEKQTVIYKYGSFAVIPIIILFYLNIFSDFELDRISFQTFQNPFILFFWGLFLYSIIYTVVISLSIKVVFLDREKLEIIYYDNHQDEIYKYTKNDILWFKRTANRRSNIIKIKIIGDEKDKIIRFYAPYRSIFNPGKKYIDVKDLNTLFDIEK